VVCDDVEIGTRLLAHPRVLFLDEPTVGLDPTTRAEIWRLVRDCATTKASTSFSRPTISRGEAETVCDRVGILHGGSLVASTNRRGSSRNSESSSELRTTDNNAWSSIHSTQPPGRRQLRAKGLVS